MQRNWGKGVVGGVIAGAVDVAPMIAMGLPWAADLSAFLHWVIVGVALTACDIGVRGVRKGLTLATALAVPTAVLVGAQDPASLLPMGIATIVLGGGLGYALDRPAGVSAAGSADNLNLTQIQTKDKTVP